MLLLLEGKSIKKLPGEVMRSLSDNGMFDHREEKHTRGPYHSTAFDCMLIDILVISQNDHYNFVTVIEEVG